jgi:thiosulfate:glutathione sulfurtransferase
MLRNRSMQAINYRFFCTNINKQKLEEWLKEGKLFRLIDVRESQETSQGIIPTAKHLRLGELREALAIDDNEFENRFKFSKFGKEDMIVFYCQSGMRSDLAAKLARSYGYKHAINYPGGWSEWIEKI